MIWSRMVQDGEGDRAMAEHEGADNSIEAGAGEEHPVLRAIGWVSVGLGLAAVGVVVGREIRKRYKFNRRTPYDFYSNAGATTASEFGMGV